jgi:hypothetical protein
MGTSHRKSNYPEEISVPGAWSINMAEYIPAATAGKQVE